MNKPTPAHTAQLGPLDLNDQDHADVHSQASKGDSVMNNDKHLEVDGVRFVVASQVPDEIKNCVFLRSESNRVVAFGPTLEAAIDNARAWIRSESKRKVQNMFENHLDEFEDMDDELQRLHIRAAAAIVVHWLNGEEKEAPSNSCDENCG